MDSIKILIAGDFAPVERVRCEIDKNEGRKIFAEIEPLVNKVDFSLLNLEAPIEVDSKNRIQKSGPYLSSTEKSIALLKEIGFSAVTLANNHLRDYGDLGVISTFDCLKKYSLDYVGAGVDIKDANTVLYKEIKGKTIAVINFCEHEYSIATELKPGANPLEITKSAISIKEAKQKADYVIVIVHGGHEYFQYPSPRMQDTYRFFIDMGADALINHHQHCYSGYEIYNEKPIFYGIGNFCFDKSNKRNSIWNEGYMVILDILDNSIQYELIPYRQCDESVRIELLEEVSAFERALEQINTAIKDKYLLYEKFKQFVLLKKKKNIESILSPYLSKYARIAAGRHILPTFLTNEKLRSIYNYTSCEAHYDELLLTLKYMINSHE